MKLRTPIHKSDFKGLLCPWRYDQHENQGVPQVETEPMITGTWVHDTGYKWRDGKISSDEALEACGDSEELTGLIEKLIWNDPDKDRQRLLEWYFAVDNEGNYVGCRPEQEKELDLLLAGRLDSMLYVEPWLKVEDLKTGWVFEKFQPEIDAYSLGGMAYLDYFGLPYNSVSFVYFWLRTGRRESIEVLKPGEDAKQLKRNLVDRFHRRIEFFNRLEPIPIPGYHCVSCQFLSGACPIGHVSGDLVQKNAEVVEKFIHTGELTPEFAPTIGLYLQRLEARADEIRKKFKPWVETNGAVPIGNSEWCITHSNRGTFDQDAAIRIIEKAKLPLEAKQKAYKVGATTLKAIHKDFPDIVDEIYDWTYSPKEIPSLTLRKVKP